jgi:methyl-accepting chemotaxis protein
MEPYNFSQVPRKEMRTRLASMVSGIKTSAETIVTASAEIAIGNNDLASRTESQAGSLERTTRAVEALTDTVRTNATNTHQANAPVVSATDIATRGGEVVATSSPRWAPSTRPRSRSSRSFP